MKSRPLACRLLAAAPLVLVFALLAPPAAAFTIADTPPFLPTPMPPNIFITLDDSGSMNNASVPDGRFKSSDSSRAYKSAKYNSLYYDPTINYVAPSWIDKDGVKQTLTTSFASAWINGYTQLGPQAANSRGTVDLRTGYRPTYQYDPETVNPASGFVSHTSADLTAIGATQKNPKGKAYYYNFKSTCTETEANLSSDSCYELKIVGTAEQQNFANWYSFYRTRNLATVAAAARAMEKVPAGARIAWQGLDDEWCKGFSSSCNGWDTKTSVDNRLRIFTGAHRTNFYKWLFRLPTSGSTPLREGAVRVGEAVRVDTKDEDDVFAFEPRVTRDPIYSCRPNFHILMTDGIWNGNGKEVNCSGEECSDPDATEISLPGPNAQTYDPNSALSKIYSAKNTSGHQMPLADIVFHYWATDLRTGSDFDNTLPPYYADRSGTDAEKFWNPKNDPASWQHIVTFTVGLGMRDHLKEKKIEWGGSTHEGNGYKYLLKNGGWPATGSYKDTSTPPAPYDQGRVYDLWHAAINGRGDLFPAERPDELAAALESAMNRIGESQSTAAALTANSTQIGTDSQVFQARFNTSDWTGSMTAFAIESDGSKGKARWDTGDPGKIPAANARQIFTWGGATKGIAFTESALSSAGLWERIGSKELLAALGDASRTQLLAYLRGDSSQEESQGGKFRVRGARMGDIVNSDPIFVGQQNYGYISLPEGKASASRYDVFVANKSRRTNMLYVGANDGMLHAFDAKTGAEKFAYVPQVLLSELGLLADPKYAHRYYVDGSPAVWDAYFKTSSSWKTVLLGSTGAGGKSVFALDVSEPDNFGTNHVLWEINDQTGPEYKNDLGRTMGQAIVARLNNGDWAAMFGNGYQSTSQRAVLYIVNLTTGALIKKFDTGAGSPAIPNGLGTPTLYDSNGDDIYDAIYAPDMLGNVWKFDLAGTDPNQWKIALNGQPLFTATSPSARQPVQPIQARLELARPPQGVPGVLVMFGSGRFFATEDREIPPIQSFYAVLDNNKTTVPRSQLQQQEIKTIRISLRGVTSDVRTVTQNKIDWVNQRGWYMDLPVSGERVIGKATVRGGRVIFSTLISSDDPCAFGGSGFLMEVDARSGANLDYPVFDTNGDGKVDDNDQILAGVPITVGIVKQPLVLDGPSNASKLMSGTSGEIQLELNRSFSQGLGRDSWKELKR